jgi:hypothetical protein
MHILNEKAKKRNSLQHGTRTCIFNHQLEERESKVEEGHACVPDHSDRWGQSRRIRCRPPSPPSRAAGRRRTAVSPTWSAPRSFYLGGAAAAAADREVT